MKELPLYGKHAEGRVSLVDDDVYEWANRWKWIAHVAPQARKIKYIRKSFRINGEYLHIPLHHAVFGVPISYDENSKLYVRNTVVDHIDRNPLNNQRSNLRECTYVQNRQNSSIASTNTSGYIGVYSIPSAFGVKIQGGFNTAKEGAIYYDILALASRGEHACLNFPDRLDEYKKIVGLIRE